MRQAPPLKPDTAIPDPRIFIDPARRDPAGDIIDAIYEAVKAARNAGRRFSPFLMMKRIRS